MKFAINPLPALFAVVVVVWPSCDSHQESSQNSRKVDPHKPANRASVKKLLIKWDKDIRSKSATEPAAAKLLNKYPLVVLAARRVFGKREVMYSAYSFNYKSNDDEICGDVQILLHGADYPNQFSFNLVGHQSNFVVDLEKWDFEKDPDPAKIRIDDPRLCSASAVAKVGNVYLERIRDSQGNDFYVLFKVVALEPKQSAYMAFIWRKLPGGTVFVSDYWKKKYGDPYAKSKSKK